MNPLKALKDKIASLGHGIGQNVKDFVDARLEELADKLKWEGYQEATRDTISRMMTLRPWKKERLQAALDIINED